MDPKLISVQIRLGVKVLKMVFMVFRMWRLIMNFYKKRNERRLIKEVLQDVRKTLSVFKRLGYICFEYHLEILLSSISDVVVYLVT